MRQKIGRILALATMGVIATSARAQIQVVTTDPTLADIARQVGGSRVRVESLSRGTDDPHQVEPRPTMVVKLARAQVFARIGMDMDSWADSVLGRSGNAQVMKGGKGYADCSRGIKVRDIPPAKIDPSMGDIHVYGNPHYLLDPANGITAAANITRALINVDSGGAAHYQKRFADFGKQIQAGLERWRAALAPHRGKLIVTYHRNWVYFMARFGLKEYGTIEPKPGVAPSPGHLNTLIRQMKADGVRVALLENFRSHRFPDLIAQQTGAQAVYVPVSVEGEAGIDGYLKLFDTIVQRLATAMKQRIA